MEGLKIRRATESDICVIEKLLYEVHKVHSDARPDLFKAGARKYNNDELVEKWDKIFDIKESFAKDIEEARARKEIGSALDAMITIYAKEKDYEFINSNKECIALVAIVSEVNVKKSEENKIVVEKSTGVKCPRCWTYAHEFSDEGICKKCHNNM